MRANKRGRQQANDPEAEKKRNCLSRCCSLLVKCCRRSSAPKPIPEPMETVVLEKTLRSKSDL